MAQRCRYRFVRWQLVEYLGEQVPHFGMSSASVECPVCRPPELVRSHLEPQAGRGLDECAVPIRRGLPQDPLLLVILAKQPQCFSLLR